MSRKKRKTPESDDEDEIYDDEEQMDALDETIQQSKVEMITKNSGNNDSEKLYLPKFIKLTNLKPGEPEYMKLRKPYIVRFHKKNRTKNPHEFAFSQLQ